ncbi:MAG: aminotransferase class I/II-fold pyridoxal phosphate-dependent enzyme [Chloroflexi bacterium]|nr:aminotransferase class I/II-fold pyridoxal phosphate-dependent enzyme [Chloroflexota bacterium]
MDAPQQSLAPATRLAHIARRLPAADNRPVAPPLYQSVAYQFASLDQLEAIYAGERPGYFYYRYGGPNHAILETTVAELEGAEAAVATSSGLTALAATLLALLHPGDHLLVDRHSYGGTYTLLTAELARLGFAVEFVDLARPGALESAARPTTRALLLETLTNPLLQVTDLPRLAAAARARGWLVLCDSTFTTPCLIQPLAHGCDLVWHASSKYFGGQGQVLGGIVAGPRALIERVRETVTHLGVAASAFDTWLAAQGLATLALRMERACQNALAVAEFLASRPEVARVYYPGLPGHPQHALARQLYPHGYGAMVSFELRGGAPAVRAFLDHLRLIPFVPSLGDVATTVSYPARTSHRHVPAAERAALGITEGLVRLSVGIEAATDILADLATALAAAPRGD